MRKFAHDVKTIIGLFVAISIVVDSGNTVGQ